jgi:hypothetical protein
MRKIELLMLQAIEERRDWKLDNTEVQCVYFDHSEPVIDRVNVLLHGHQIATVTPQTVEICDCKYQTATTKSRLNVLLRHHCYGAGIYQSNFKWYAVGNAETPELIEPGTSHVFSRETGWKVQESSSV